MQKKWVFSFIIIFIIFKLTMSQRFLNEEIKNTNGTNIIINNTLRYSQQSSDINTKENTSSTLDSDSTSKKNNNKTIYTALIIGSVLIFFLLFCALTACVNHYFR
jgi:hypothetical protein